MFFIHFLFLITFNREIWYIINVFRYLSIYSQKKGALITEKLLPSCTIRRLKLLEFLNSWGQWVPINYVAKELSCTSQTVLSDCEHLENEWPEYVTFNFSKKRGVLLQTVKNHPISDLYKKIMKDSPMFALMEVIFFHPGEDSNFYSQQLFISDSSLYRTFRSMKPMLNLRNIECNQTSYQMTSENELQIRYFLISYFLEINKISDWPFPLEKNKLLEAVAIIEKKFPFNMSTSFTVYILYATAIAIIREQQGFKVAPEIIQQKLAANPINQFDELDTFLTYNFPEVDKQSFYLFTFWWDYTWDNPQEKINIENISNNYIDLLSASLKSNITPEDRQELVQWMTHVYSRHKFYPYQMFILYDTYRYSTVTIKKTYTFYSQKVTECLEQIEKKSKFPWKTTYLDEILHKTLMIWTGLLQSIEEVMQPQSIFILSNISIEHAKILAYLTEQRFNDKVEISFAADETALAKIEEYDICLSNYTIDWVNEKNLIVVEDIPSAKNWTDLRTLINLKSQI